MTRQRIVIDTDPGVDDAMAIIFALAHPALEVVGITTVHGNVDLGRTTRNALGLVELAGLDIPVAAGADRALNRPPFDRAGHVHGVEGLGNVPPMRPGRRPDPRSAATFLCETVARAPGTVTICAIGPLTNLALALEHDPAIAERAAGVVLMGGAVDVGGNVTAQSEFNVWADPEAADRVFAAPWTVTQVGLDITMQVLLSRHEVETIAAAAPRLGGFVKAISAHYLDFHRNHRGIDGCPMHDPSAIITLTDPDLFRRTPAPLEVATDEAVRGRTRRSDDRSRPAVDICTGVDAAGVRRVFVETLSAADARLPGPAGA